jgi:NADPH:quinone reductase-like Zn-dependent oxidoreductase
MKSVLVRKPAKVTFDQAASAPVAALTALQGLRDKGRIQQGQKVLINGAAGGVGTFAVQMAKSFAANVTGVCSTTNVDMVRSIGADCVIDYTKEDFTRSGQRYDLVLDCVGNHSLSACRRVLNPKGTLVMVGAPDDSPVIRLSGSFAGSTCIITVREPEDGLFHCESEPRGSDHLGRVHGDRESNAGHRQALQVE